MSSHMIASAQLQMIVQQHAAPRPSTSPTPTGFFTDVRKTQGSRQSKLRPLPPRGGLGSTGGFSMMIEGSKTGEEKTVSVVERREATMQRPAAMERKPVLPKPQEPDRSEKDQAKIRKLEAELKKAQTTIRERTSENDGLKSKVSSMECSLSMQQSENERLEEKVKILTAANATKDKELENLNAALQRHEKGLESHDAQNAKLSQELQELRSKFSTDQTKWSSEKSQMVMMAGKLRDEVAMLKADAERNAKRIQDMSSSDQQRIDRLEMERKESRDRESNLRAESMKAKQQLAENEKKMAEWKQSIEQCNKYIVTICQPSFSVVKDESLAPVTPGVNTPDGGGFVLVPLPLLLEGYGLLPGDMKRKIAQDYEAQKKQDVSEQQPAAVASAGNFAVQHGAIQAGGPAPPSNRGSFTSGRGRK